jgi:flagellar hook-basal body complex protein FliE
MINLNPNMNPSLVTRDSGFGIRDSELEPLKPSTESQTQKANFSDALKLIDSYISDVDGTQQASDASIKNLLSSSTADITSVVSEVARADVSFKLLVGVRNKLIEAYKQTMNMPL